MKFSEIFGKWENVEEYSSGTVIFAERSEADWLYFIMSGEVEFTLRGESLGIDGEGGVFGEMAIIGSATRNATAIARTDVRLARMDGTQFRKIISRHPAFSLHVMSALANRLRAVDRYITARLDDAE